MPPPMRNGPKKPMKGGKTTLKPGTEVKRHPKNTQKMELTPRKYLKHPKMPGKGG